MKRTKLKDRTLPHYSKGEEILNVISHILGAILGILVVVFSPIIAVKHGNVSGIVTGVIFGSSLILLYTVSTIYHSLKKDSTARKVFQILDHSIIFVLIAGTYTPYTLTTIAKHNLALGLCIFIGIWIITVIGIVLNSIDLKMFSKFSLILYVLMGWIILPVTGLLIKLLSKNGFMLLLYGGILYTVGAVIYAIGKLKKVPYMHAIFHIFVLLGSIFHAISVLKYVIV